MEFLKEKCEPREKCLSPLSEEEAAGLLKEVPEWGITDGRLQREFRFRDFQGAMDFVNEVARLAREQDHHPDIHVFYNRVVLSFYTHKANALTKNDFIMAARIKEIERS